MLATGPDVLQVARPEALHLLETVWGTQGCGMYGEAILGCCLIPANSLSARSMPRARIDVDAVTRRCDAGGAGRADGGAQQKAEAGGRQDADQRGEFHDTIKEAERKAAVSFAELRVRPRGVERGVSAAQKCTARRHMAHTHLPPGSL